MQKLIGQLKAWWDKRDQRRLASRMTKVWNSGVGQHQAVFRAGGESDEELGDEVLSFLNEIIAASRRPYGVGAYGVKIARTPLSTLKPGWTWKMTQERSFTPFAWNEYWQGNTRDQIRQKLGDLNKQEGYAIVVVVVSLGDAFKVLLDQTVPQSRPAR